MTEYETLPRYLNAAADVLEVHSEAVIEDYEARLLNMNSPLVNDADTLEQVKVQARIVLGEAVARLREQGVPSGSQQGEDHRSDIIGTSRACKGVHASEFLRAVVALFEAALSVVVGNLAQSPASKSEVAIAAVAILNSVMERVSKATVAYTDYLLEAAHQSHVAERRRISRELHDRVAHSIMAVFQNLELYELHRPANPSKAEHRLELAKRTTQEVFELIRTLSLELRNTSAEEGLEAALVDFLHASMPQDTYYSSVSVEGDEFLIAPHVRDELFLILREGLRNAAKHSGAKSVKIYLSITENQVVTTIEDDGRGFEPDNEVVRNNKVGLVSMAERASLLGGALNLTSAPGKGTKIEVLLPLPTG